MRVRVIENPAAGSARNRHVVDQARRLLGEAGHRVEVCATAGRGDGERLARAAAVAGVDVIVAAGGDGTLNEVTNGIASAPNGLTRCAVGLLPVGTGNDFARALGIAKPESALAALTAGHSRPLDLVSLGSRVFLNASAGGLTAETSAHVSSELKQTVGRLAYLVGGARAMLEYDPVPVHIAADGLAFDATLQLFAVCNGAYIGGGHQLAPTARPDDGLVDVCLVRAASALDFLALLPRFSSGSHVDDEDVIYFRTRELTLTFARAIRLNTDGEVLESSDAHYAVRPGAVRFIAPRSASAPVVEGFR